LLGNGNSICFPYSFDFPEYAALVWLLCCTAWIRRFSAVGDMTAVNPYLAKDFGEMARLGLVERIEDIEIFNFFRHDGELNVHAEYGYLVNKDTAAVVAEWWRQQPRPD